MTASRSSQMDELVARTGGAQPLRRLFHALSGVAVAAGLTWLPLSRWAAVGILAAGLAAAALLDLARLRIPAVNAAFFRLFRHLASPREARGVASSTWYVLGFVVVVALFPRPSAVSGILVLALSDPAASYLGRRWGRRRFLGGTVLGSLAFLATALAILGLRHPLPAAVCGAAVATLAERVSWPLDDNLTLPSATAATVVLLEALL